MERDEPILFRSTTAFNEPTIDGTSERVQTNAAATATADAAARMEIRLLDAGDSTAKQPELRVDECATFAIDDLVS